ncbi:MAG: hypothetical protein BGO87_00725 [Flavobacteriia bacterium 40-80]|nr:MAG: hypothetical protein BGO87_00725 [Flavobacteriia bacterium 40-80]
MLNTKNTTIPKNTSNNDDTDFQYLKEKGIEYIESIGGALWTDYNEHDPGITTLEILVYAITDLGNRMTFPIEDLLTKSPNDSISQQFYTADQILPTRAVTPNDYRKLFIDIKGVRNCWIQKYNKTVYANCQDGELSYDPEAFSSIPKELKNEFGLKGLNQLIVDYETDPDIDITAQIAKINQIITTTYHQNRNLCEDLVAIKKVEKQKICLCTDIELEQTADQNKVHAAILFEIDNYFLPRLKFYSVKEMLRKGYRTDEIFEGPLLEHGFIDDRELMDSELKTQIRLSDLINIIADIPGVKNINEISISDCDSNDSVEQWVICIEEGKRPELCDKSVFNYRKDILPVQYNKDIVDELLRELIEQATGKSVPSSGMTLSIPEGKFFDMGQYTTIQNDFPDTYGIGINGLSSNYPTARKSKAKQLKAYLLFFDQILATYFSYLSKVKDLLAIHPELQHVYFTQAVEGLRGLPELVTNYPQNNNEQLSENLLGFMVDSNAVRNDILDHLISRFAESFNSYAFLLNDIYGSMAGEMKIRAKSAFLAEYVDLSSGRGLGFDYYKQPLSELWNTGNVAGAVKRIARLSGMKNYHRRNLVNEYVAVTGITGSYGWTIKDDFDNLILWSTHQNHPTIEEAVESLYLATLLITETTFEEVENALEDLQPGTYVIAGNLELEQLSVSSFFFRVVNPDVSPSDPARIVAASHDYYVSIETFKAGIENVLNFIKYRFTEEGMFMLEHILIRPMKEDAPASEFLPFCADDCANSCCIDPYSFKVTIVLPGYTERFSSMDFREFMEQLICEEIPAHIIPKICWVGNRKNTVPDNKNDLLNFENAFRSFLEVKTDPGNDISQQLEELIDKMRDLNTIYPKGILGNCENESDPKIILGRSKIGSLGSSTTAEE